MFLRRICTVLQTFEDYIASVLFRSHADGFALAVAGGVNKQHAKREPPFSLRDIVGDGFLWAVPRSRRTLEKRLTRKFGNPNGFPHGVVKMIQRKTTLRTCNVCGDDHEVGVLCPSCYKKVIDETKLMQDAIQEKLGLEPIEKEVVVLYNGEAEDKPKEFFESKRIVELPKERPSWFSKNLLQETTQQSANTADVKPPRLG